MKPRAASSEYERQTASRELRPYGLIDPCSLPGQILDDRYEILGLLAEGGMGRLNRARRTLLGDEVAIKIVRGDHGGAGAHDRFFRESRASAKLRHPYIVSILDFNVDDEDHPFLVMELLNGLSVKDEIASKGRMSLAEVQAIVPSLCTALQFAHDQGIVHRDLKPANIVAHEFAPGQRVYKVVDFGLANLRDTDETLADGTARVSRHGRVCVAGAVDGCGGRTHAW